MAYWIGLTGGIGSGKSTAAAEFARLGVPVVDADAVSRSLTAENGVALPAIRMQFGNEMFNETGHLNRAALRDLVFRRPEEKAKLEALMFPLIVAEIQSQQARHTAAVYGVLDVPTLVENIAFQRLVQRVLVVDVDETTQIERVQKRSSLSAEEINRIIAAQASRSERLLMADDVLRNEQGLLELAEKVGRLNRYYQSFIKPCHK